VLFILKMQQFVVRGLRTTKDLNPNPNADPDLYRYQTWIRYRTVPLPNAVVRYRSYCTAIKSEEALTCLRVAAPSILLPRSGRGLSHPPLEPLAVHPGPVCAHLFGGSSQNYYGTNVIISV
jgi:hypothetical protein